MIMKLSLLKMEVPIIPLKLFKKMSNPTKRSESCVTPNHMGSDLSLTLEGKKQKKLQLWSMAMMFIAFVVIIFRDYNLFITPRFWAEEGNWFSYAYSQNWIRVIFSFVGEYYAFYPRFATFMASRIIPLEHAPLITTLMAFFVQYAVVMIVIYDNSILWNTPFKKAVIVTIVLFFPKSAEIWLNTNGSQYYLSLISVLILLGDDTYSSNAKKYAYRILIAVAGLTGVLSCLLTPLFFFKAMAKKNREAFIHTGILLICSIIQIYALIQTPNPDRSGLPDLATASLIIWIRNFLAPFSIPLAEVCSKYVRRGLYGKEMYYYAGYGVLFIQAMILWFLKRKMIQHKGILLIGSFLLLSFFSTYFAVAGKKNFALLHINMGNRYFYATNVLIMAMVFFSIDFKPKTLIKKISSVFLALLLLAGIINSIYFFNQEKLKKRNWPVWREEIQIWKKDPTYKPKTWPTGWKVSLHKVKNEYNGL